jgi:hypothetical protein
MGSREGVKKMRKGKSTNNLKRSSENKNPRGYFLIVVEGEQTEYNYFESLKRELKLSTTDVKIVPAYGGDPLEIVTTAYDLSQQKQYD